MDASLVPEDDMEISYDARTQNDLDEDLIDIDQPAFNSEKLHVPEDYDMGDENVGNIEGQPFETHTSTNYDDIMVDDDSNGIVAIGAAEFHKDVAVHEEELLDADPDEDVDEEITETPLGMGAVTQQGDHDVNLRDNEYLRSDIANNNLHTADGNSSQESVGNRASPARPTPEKSLKVAESPQATTTGTTVSGVGSSTLGSSTLEQPRYPVPTEATGSSRSVDAPNLTPSLRSESSKPFVKQAAASRNSSPSSYNQETVNETQERISSKKRPSTGGDDDDALRPSKKAKHEPEMNQYEGLSTIDRASKPQLDRTQSSKATTDDEHLLQTHVEENVPQGDLLERSVGATAADPAHSTAIGQQQAYHAEDEDGPVVQLGEAGLDVDGPVEQPGDSEKDRESFSSRAADDSALPGERSERSKQSLYKNEEKEEDDVWRYPITVLYEGEEYQLFAEEGSKVEDHHFLEDRSLIYKTFDVLLRECRDVLTGSIHEDDELELEAPDFGLILSEGSAIAALAQLFHVIDLHRRMADNEGVKDPGALNLVLRTKTNFPLRFQRLRNAQDQGYGLSQVPEIIGRGETYEDSAEEAGGSGETADEGNGENYGDPARSPAYGEEESHGVGTLRETDVITDARDDANDDDFKGEDGEGAEEIEGEVGEFVENQDDNEWDASVDKANPDELRGTHSGRGDEDTNDLETNSAYEAGDDYQPNDNETGFDIQPNAGETRYDAEYAIESDEETVPPEVAEEYPDTVPANGESTVAAEITGKQEIIDLTDDNEDEQQPAGDGFVYVNEDEDADGEDKYIAGTDDEDDGTHEFEANEDEAGYYEDGDEDENGEGPDQSLAEAVEGHDESIYYDANDENDEGERNHVGESAEPAPPSSTATAEEGDEWLIDYEEDERKHNSKSVQAANSDYDTTTSSHEHANHTIDNYVDTDQAVKPKGRANRTNALKVSGSGTHAPSLSPSRKRSREFALDGADDGYDENFNPIMGRLEKQRGDVKRLRSK